jgi:cytochrome c oxidase subunit 3
MVSLKSNQYRHPFHIVTASPWPFVLSFNLLGLVIGFVMYLHNYQFGLPIVKFGFIGLFFILFAWWRDIIFEATYENAHTSYVQQGLRYGMLLFILSEVMFFFAFFWAFFHSSLSPAIQIGAVWPPLGIHVFNPWEIPFVNTLILLLSGVWATLAHKIIKTNLYEKKVFFFFVTFSLGITILLGMLFSCFQLYEYIIADFSISDGIYGSVFYLATGFHGFHVIVGTLFLIVMFFRHINYHFVNGYHFGMDAAIWYWHFVDVVWLFLFISIYWWGS